VSFEKIEFFFPEARQRLCAMMQLQQESAAGGSGFNGPYCAAAIRKGSCRFGVNRVAFCRGGIGVHFRSSPKADLNSDLLTYRSAKMQDGRCSEARATAVAVRRDRVSENRWDNLENTDWDSMGPYAKVGLDKLLIGLARVAPLLGTNRSAANGVATCVRSANHRLLRPI
jgi:hypothetical protein